MPVTTTLLGLSLFSLASMAYVFKFRGQARFEDFSEYLRKGWPIFTPLNCLLYLFTQKRARSSVPNMAQFPELDVIKKNWATIRDEALNLYQARHFDQTTKPQNMAYYDLGFRTFYKYGWSKFYLHWYGTELRSAQELCPKTLEILKQVPSVNGAMFSLLPAGSELTRHLDPVACSLRYHLGLSTPNSDQCFINIDGQQLSWRDGEAFLFDETSLHFAKNQTQMDRVILMCDVNRPTWGLGSVINFFYKLFAKLSVVPNREGDQRGLANRIFATLSPLLAKSKALKQTNLPAYKALKYGVNTLLISLLLTLVWGFLNLMSNVGSSLSVN